ncbi:MAG: hypothetical protein LH471_12430 [Salinibacterium sp.]|nr:hypothetical protein [Salinibacterium sp.]
MSIGIRNRVVVFDRPEVISRSPSGLDRAALLAVAGTAAQPFCTSYWNHRDGLDQGTISAVKYWRLVASDTGAQGGPATVQELWITGFRSSDGRAI